MAEAAATDKLKDTGEKKPIIIIKKIKRGHAAHHGGAWKVAYADFVTAMMCFFLVMWLMSADEETLAAISHYFNNPNEPPAETAAPSGQKHGMGERILKGANGAVPDDLVRDPIERIKEPPENKEIAELATELMDGQLYALDITVDYVKFSVPEDLLFRAGTADLHEAAEKYLGRLGQLFKGYRGYITIEGNSDSPPRSMGGYASAYEFTLARAVSVMNFFVDRHWVQEERMMPVGSGERHPISPNTTEEGRKMNRRIEFTLTYRRNR